MRQIKSGARKGRGGEGGAHARSLRSADPTTRVRIYTGVGYRWRRCACRVGYVRSKLEASSIVRVLRDESGYAKMHLRADIGNIAF